MTGDEWLTSIELRPMFDTVALTASARKLRLFATACCRRLAPQFKDERSLNMVDASEQFADGDLTEAELRAAFEEAAEAVEAIHWEGGDAVDQASAETVLGLHAVLDITQVFEGIGEVVGSLATAEVWDRIYAPGRHWSESQEEETEVSDAGREKEASVLACILRDIVGNPFRPVAFDPAWRTDTALALARQMYDSREFSAMPILADALQDAGCDSDDILNHCREPGTHVRGCWVVDLVLGKQ